MDISFNCERCGQNITIDESGAGVAVQCPTCGHSLVVPSPPSQTGSIPPPSPKGATPRVADTSITGKRKGKSRTKKFIGVSTLVIGLMLIVFFGRSMTRRDRSPLGKTEQQVDRLYGEPVKVDGSTRSYLLGDIIAEVDFSSYEGASEAYQVSFHKDSPVSIISNRITMQESQRLMQDVSGGGQWKLERGDARHSTHDRIDYVYREKSLRLIYRRLHYVTTRELEANYYEEGGLLFIGTDISPRDVPFSLAFAAEPSSGSFFSSATAPSDSNAPTEFGSDKLAALDAKNGFRSYKLGSRLDEFSGLQQARTTVDETSYEVQDFDKTLGAFELSGVTLTFEAGILKEIEIKADGKQNADGLKQTLTEAYGEPNDFDTSGLSITYGWKANDVELRFSEFYNTAHAKFTSKKVDAKLITDRENKVREAAPEAAKQL
jgi:DNA-directed RNA polymerase subunit RPC12/RpoP